MMPATSASMCSLSVALMPSRRCVSTSILRVRPRPARADRGDHARAPSRCGHPKRNARARSRDSRRSVQKSTRSVGTWNTSAAIWMRWWRTAPAVLGEKPASTRPDEWCGVVSRFCGDRHGVDRDPPSSRAQDAPGLRSPWQTSICPWFGMPRSASAILEAAGNVLATKAIAFVGAVARSEPGLAWL